MCKFDLLTLIIEKKTYYLYLLDRMWMMRNEKLPFCLPHLADYQRNIF
jgi:hypothetical protein